MGEGRPKQLPIHHNLRSGAARTSFDVAQKSMAESVMQSMGDYLRSLLPKPKKTHAPKGGSWCQAGDGPVVRARRVWQIERGQLRVENGLYTGAMKDFAATVTGRAQAAI